MVMFIIRVPFLLMGSSVVFFMFPSIRCCCVWWKLADNVVMNMKNAGLSLMESFDNDIHDNYVEESRYGIRLSVGSGRNKVHDNTFHNILRGEERRLSDGGSRLVMKNMSRTFKAPQSVSFVMM